ncbi:class I SAM-dependent methyltransferase [Rheinheimera maricola]|uniref:Class I SAM-dependent methyltransferase n=1 Tax=Rheinheimera maricola TaxID=2793282 RepID=A0ABS7X8Y9_9GAMM|nr:class I SAM-dependent methyltransferase [Rheinheimera maricola]MBZ9612011.1 class I SAM-dependent methyltransferase [Rheinheimera maricola]
MKPALSEKERLSPAEWRQINQGEALARAIAEVLEPMWQRIFGYYLLKVGDLSCQLDTRNCKIQHHINVGRDGSDLMLQADADALPFSEHSVDAVLLSHYLEFTPDPHHVVREAHRVLRADGYLLLTGINPFSLVGLLRCWPALQQRYPWQGRFFSASRIKDWLHLMGFEVVTEQRFFCSALLAREYNTGWAKQLAEQYLSYFSSSYLIVARKRELPLTPIRPKWQLTPAFAQQVKGASARQQTD